MDTNPSVSIIMSVANRPQNLLNSLTAWSMIDYPDYDFVIIDNGSENIQIDNIVKEMKTKLPITFYKQPKVNLNRTWNLYGKSSRGDYVVFSMMDEIISHKDILQKMVTCHPTSRVSIFTYFMTMAQTLDMDSYDWKDDPTIIPKPFTNQTSAGLISHITGNYRKNWDYFGWFRDNQNGHLWVDQDLHLRELVLGSAYHCRTPEGVYCLHQYHPSTPVYNDMENGYKYKNEAQARLLEPAERED